MDRQWSLERQKVDFQQANDATATTTARRAAATSLFVHSMTATRVLHFCLRRTAVATKGRTSRADGASRSARRAAVVFIK